MNKTIRTIIFYAFLTLFLLSAPTLVLYTAGYRLDFRTGRLERLGSAVFKSEPSGATILIDDTALEERTPTTVKLAANEYSIKIIKDGYSAWSKKLNVKSRETTFAEDVVLWKEEAPSLIEPQALTNAHFSPDKRYLVWIEENGRLHVFDLIRGLEIGTTPPRLDLEVRPRGPTSPITFSSDNTAALVGGEDGALTIPLENPSLAKQWSTQIFWGSTPNTLYIFESGLAIAQNILTNRREALGRSLPIFRLSGTNLWSIGEERGQTVLARTTLGIPEAVPDTVIKLPPGSYEFINLPLDLLFIHEHSSDQLFVLDPKNPTISLVNTVGSSLTQRYNRDSEFELLSWTPTELWRSNVDRGTSQLLRRQSTPIRRAAWYPGEYALFSTDREVSALELDDRDERNVTTIVEVSDGRIIDFTVTKNGAKLYYAVTGGSTPGLYVRELQ